MGALRRLVGLEPRDPQSALEQAKVELDKANAAHAEKTKLVAEAQARFDAGDDSALTEKRSAESDAKDSAEFVQRAKRRVAALESEIAAAEKQKLEAELAECDAIVESFTQDLRSLVMQPEVQAALKKLLDVATQRDLLRDRAWKANTRRRQLRGEPAGSEFAAQTGIRNDAENRIAEVIKAELGLVERQRLIDLLGAR